MILFAQASQWYTCTCTCTSPGATALARKEDPIRVHARSPPPRTNAQCKSHVPQPASRALSPSLSLFIIPLFSHVHVYVYTCRQNWNLYLYLKTSVINACTYICVRIRIRTISRLGSVRPGPGPLSDSLRTCTNEVVVRAYTTCVFMCFRRTSLDRSNRGECYRVFCEAYNIMVSKGRNCMFR